MSMNDDVLLDESDGQRGDGSLLVFLGGLVLGALLGAVLALLFTPKRGEEMREQLRDTSTQVSGHASVAAGQVREQASALQGRAQSTLGQAMERAQTFAGTIRDQTETRVVETGTAAGDLAGEAPQDANVAAGTQSGA